MTSIFLSVVSFRLSPLIFIRVSCDDSENPTHPAAFVSSVAVSVKRFFLQNAVVSPVPKPQPGGARCVVLSVSYHIDLLSLAEPARDLIPCPYSSRWGSSEITSCPTTTVTVEFFVKIKPRNFWTGLLLV